LRVKDEVEVETVEIRKKLLPDVHMHRAQRSFLLSRIRQTTISVRFTACDSNQVISMFCSGKLWIHYSYLPLCFASSETFLACSPDFLYCNRFSFLHADFCCRGLRHVLGAGFPFFLGRLTRAHNGAAAGACRGGFEKIVNSVMTV